MLFRFCDRYLACVLRRLTLEQLSRVRTLRLLLVCRSSIRTTLLRRTIRAALTNASNCLLPNVVVLRICRDVLTLLMIVIHTLVLMRNVETVLTNVSVRISRLQLLLVAPLRLEACQGSNTL